MSTLREILEAKERRRMVVPIQVSDATADHEAWMGIYVAIEAAKNRNDDAVVVALRAQLGEASDKVQSHWASIELEALPSDEWEKASRVWRSEADATDSDNDMDWAKALAPLLAESCTDPELRDVEWWQTQLARPGWSEGDRDALKVALLRLNVSALEPHVPKD